MDNSRVDTSLQNVLLKWQDLPSWMKDNEYILTGYRKPSRSYNISLRSVLKIHNETGNIWSHLLGAVLFAISLYHFYHEAAPILRSASISDIAAVCFYYAGVVNCFLLSTGFHVFANHSAEVHRLGNELDHLGVVLVIYGSTIPSTYFGFYCDHTIRNVYWALSTLFALASAVFTLRPKFRQPTYRRVRFYMYTLLGLSSFLPVVHGITLYGFEEFEQRMSVSYFLGLGVLNFTGAAIYAARIPERWYPITFDIWGSSHQIMHVLVVMGALSHERGLLKAVDWWGAEGKLLCK